MRCKIKIWSRVGHTPITNRLGAFCDELVSMEIEVTDYKDAIAQVQKIMQETQHADKGYYHIAEWDNQNLNHGWVTFPQKQAA